MAPLQLTWAFTWRLRVQATVERLRLRETDSHSPSAVACWDPTGGTLTKPDLRSILKEPGLADEAPSPHIPQIEPLEEHVAGVMPWRQLSVFLWSSMFFLTLCRLFIVIVIITSSASADGPFGSFH